MGKLTICKKCDIVLSEYERTYGDCNYQIVCEKAYGKGIVHGGILSSSTTPEQITALQAENAELRARLEKSVELPCEYGITIYYVHEPDGEIKMSHVIGFYYNGFYLSLDIEGIGLRHEKLLGNTIFLTYKEVTDFKYTRKKAESALAEHEREADI